MKLAEATFLAEALQEWDGWRCVSVDLYGHPAEDEKAYKVRMIKHPGMFADLTDPDIEAAYARLSAIEAGETYPDMRPWFYGFIDAINRGAIVVEFYPAGASDRFPPVDPVRLRITGYDGQNEYGGVTIRAEPPEETRDA